MTDFSLKSKPAHPARQAIGQLDSLQKNMLDALDEDQVKKQLNDVQKKVKHPVKLYAFATKVSDEIEGNCKRVGFEFYTKPSKVQMLDQFRHMADDLEEDQKNPKNIKKTAPPLEEPGDDEEN